METQIDPLFTNQKIIKFYRHRNIFVTGSTGLLGSWLTRYLLNLHANVIVLIRDQVPTSNLALNASLPDVTVVRGAIEDYSLLERIVTEYEIDSVFHLAAQTIAPIANRNPLSTFETNIKGTWNILEAVRRSPLVKQLIVASSDKAYGDQAILPYTEETPLKGQHPYDASKSCADLLSHMYHVSYDLPVCITRCGNLFGGGDLNFNRLVPSVIRSVLFNESPVLRSNGRYVRDFFYVEDAAIAMIVLCAAMVDETIKGEAFNFGNENKLTVLQMVRLILKRLKSDLPLTIHNDLENEIKMQYLSAAKARKLLGWQPHYQFNDAIDRTITWYKEYFATELEGYRAKISTAGKQSKLKMHR